MRTLLIAAVSALLFSAASKADGNDAKVMSEIKACMATENLDSLAALRTNKEARTAEEKCFVGCMMKNLHVLNSDGQYDAELFKDHINHCPELDNQPQKKAAAIEVADSCTGKVTACSGYCECGLVAGNCLSQGMETRGHETIYGWLGKIIDKMDS
ncbi:uncharacterized protein LOC126210444 [Schistocerca nitens]|uniref:uncharacterized protein LOC126210444 n=1 Tax=Schistocerca nitens TaxID=7011 RepID=UPI0021180C33|nr:uncharacterized protein LOC126210444 [Schistocerca nitens]